MSVLPSGRGADLEFRILGPLELLENGHQVVRHRTRALRARPARLARFIEEQRAPPGSTTFAPGRPAAHLGKFGDRVRGNSPDRPHAGETPLLGKGAVLAYRFDRPLAAESDESRQRDDDRRSTSGRCRNARFPTRSTTSRQSDRGGSPSAATRNCIPLRNFIAPGGFEPPASRL